MSVRIGDKVMFRGSQWYVNSFDALTNSVNLVRTNDGTLKTELVKVTIEELEVQFAEPSQRGFRASTFVEDEMRRMGINVGDWDTYDGPSTTQGIVADMIKAMSEQFESLTKQATSSGDAMKEWAKVFSADSIPEYERGKIITYGTVDAQGDGGDKLRRAESLDKQFELPGMDGWAVFWKEPRRRGVGVFVNIIGEDTDYGGGEVICEAVDNLAAAWVFVDYLNDEELGKAIAIREGATVMFANIVGAGWEAIADADVPEEYR